MRRLEIDRILALAQQAVGCGDLVKVAKMAKAIAEMELGFAASPDFSAREMLDAANEALAVSSTTGGGVA